jgi:hypothetical protein
LFVRVCVVCYKFFSEQRWCELCHFSEMCTCELVQEQTGTVTVVDDSRHGLSDGDYVRFIEATPLIRPLLQRHTSFCCRESTRPGWSRKHNAHGKLLLRRAAVCAGARNA